MQIVSNESKFETGKEQEKSKINITRYDYVRDLSCGCCLRSCESTGTGVQVVSCLWAALVQAWDFRALGPGLGGILGKILHTLQFKSSDVARAASVIISSSTPAVVIEWLVCTIFPAS